MTKLVYDIILIKTSTYLIILNLQEVRCVNSNKTICESHFFLIFNIWMNRKQRFLLTENKQE